MEHTRNRFQTVLPVCLLLACLVGQSLLSIRETSPTCDEFAHHLANGYSYLKTGDFRMDPASPPLARVWPAIPLIFLKAKLPLEHESWVKGNSPEFAKQFFYQSNPGMIDVYFFWARIFVLFLSVGFGLLLYFFSTKVFGRVGGIASLVLYVFSPNIIAHSSLATVDLMIAFFFFATLISFWKYLIKPSVGLLILTGVLAGCAFLSKFSALLLFPCLWGIALMSGKLKWVNFPRMMGFLLVLLTTVWAGYFFEYKPLLKNTPDSPKKASMYQKVGGEKLLHFANETPVPLSTFSSALTSMLFNRKKGTNAFLDGEWSKTGWWYYYFRALSIKETIPCLLLALAGFLWVWRFPIDRVSKAVLAVPIILFFLLTLGDRAQAGIRYFLPIFPLFFMLGGGVVAYVAHRFPRLRLLVIFLLVWHVYEAVRASPYYFSYFNQLVGGSENGYKHLRDSNVDWGQDLKGAMKYVLENKYGQVVVSSLCMVDPAYYGVQSRSAETDEFLTPRSTVYVIGVHWLDAFEWSRRIQPTKKIGHSMFIYDFRDSKYE